MVLNLKRVPPKSRPTAPSRKQVSDREAVRKDSAVHVSLSSDSLVKQPGTRAVPSPVRLESRRNTALPINIGGVSTGVSEVLRGRAIPPKRRRARTVYIGWGVYPCQHPTRTYSAAIALHCTFISKDRKMKAGGAPPRSRALMRAHRPSTMPYCGHIRPPFLPFGVASPGGGGVIGGRGMCLRRLPESPARRRGWFARRSLEVMRT
jgi:hypothetical protein